MRSGNTTQTSLRLRTLVIPAIVSVVCLFAASARAHPIVIVSGDLRVQNDRIIMTFAFDDHLLEHEGVAAGDDAGFGRFMHGLSDSLVLLDDEGTRLEQTVANAASVDEHRAITDMVGGDEAEGASRRGCRIAAPIDDDVRYVTLQQRAGRAETVRRRQIQLHVYHMDGRQPLATLRLSTGGNTQTINVDALRNARKPKREDVVADERIHAPAMHVDVNGRSTTINVVLPASILATFVPVDRSGPDVFTNTDLLAGRADVAAFVQRHARVRINERLVQPTVDRVVLLGPDDDFSDDEDTPRKLCYWSARLAVKLQFTAQQPCEHLNVSWTGFNSRAMQMRAQLTHHDHRVGSGTLTTYANALTWAARGAQSTWRIGQREGETSIAGP